MEALFIESSQETPSIILNKELNTFIIGDRSYPEDAFEFYSPIIHWLDEYRKEPNENTVFDFKLDYFNTASSKQIFKILLILEEIATKKKVTVRWHYKSSDKEMYNHGEIFSKIVNAPFEMIEIS